MRKAYSYNMGTQTEILQLLFFESDPVDITYISERMNTDSREVKSNINYLLDFNYIVFVPSTDSYPHDGYRIHANGVLFINKNNLIDDDEIGLPPIPTIIFTPR